MAKRIMDKIGYTALKCRTNYNDPNLSWTCERTFNDLYLVAIFTLLITVIRIFCYTKIFPWFTHRLDIPHKRRTRSHDEIWLFMTHSTSGIYGLCALYFEQYAKTVFGRRNTMKSLWMSYPAHSTFLSPRLQLFYIVSAGIWMHNSLDLFLEKLFGFGYPFIVIKFLGFKENERYKSYKVNKSLRKNFTPMLLHHTSTIFLIYLSYTQGYINVGHLVLVTADISDIVLNFIKALYDLDIKVFVNFCLGLLMSSWIYTRHYLSFNIFRSIQFDSINELARTCPSWDLTGRKCLGGYFMYALCCSLFGILQVLFIYWLQMIVRTALTYLETDDPECLSEADEDEFQAKTNLEMVQGDQPDRERDQTVKQRTTAKSEFADGPSYLCIMHV